MLVTCKELLTIAETQNRAIGAFNVSGLETIQAVIGAAEELNEPVIIEFAQVHEEENVMTLEILGPIMIQFAKKASVPIAVHLDHAVDLQYIEKALKMGFTSIMYDGSSLPFEDNIKNTKKAVELANEYGASVEGEIGKMAGYTLNDEKVVEIREVDTNTFTDVNEAKAFVEKTGVDMLACSFGTSHGLYTAAPKLNFSLVEKLKSKLQASIVMHGGSGVSEQDIHKVIDAGVRKINYYSYMAKAGADAVNEKLKKENMVFFHEISNCAIEAMKTDVKNAITLFKNKGVQ